MMKTSYQTRLLALMALAAVLLYMAVCFVKGDGDIRMFPIKEQESITRVHLKNDSGVFEFYQNEEEQWQVKHGKEYLAEETKMNLLTKALRSFETERKLDAEIPAYGLESPKAEVSFETDQGNTYSFAVGNETMSKNHVYVKNQDTDEIYVTLLSNVAQLDGSIGAYRSRQIFQMKMAAVTGLTWKEKGKDDIVLKKTKDTWNMEMPYKTQARKIEIEEFLASMKDWNVCSFADTALFSEKQMGLTGERVLILEDDKGAVQELEIGQAMSGLLPVRTGGKENILLLYEDEADLSVLEADKLLLFAPLKADVGALDSIRITMADTVCEIQIDSKNEVYFCNGKPVEPELFYSFFVSYIGLNASGGGVEIGKTTGKTVAEFENIYKNGESVTLTLKERDEETCSMFVDNSESGFYMSNEKLITLMEKLYRMCTA